MRQYYTTIFFFFTVAMSFAQPLSGTYIIGSTNAAPYNTLTNAVQKLQTAGMSGPVTFLLNNTQYNNASGEVFPITISPISGSSPINTLTIKPNIGRTVAINANEINNYTGIPGVIKINGAKNIIIDGSNVVNGTTRNLTFSNNNTPGYTARCVIWLASNGTTGVSNIHVKNTTLNFSNRNGQEQLLTGVFMGSNATIIENNSLAGTISTAAHSNITITNNIFTNVRQGVFVFGSTVPSQKTNQVNVVGNTFGSATEALKPSVATYFSYVDSFNVTDNQMSGFMSPGNGNLWSAPIHSVNGSNFNIKRNTITDVKTTINYQSPQAIYLKGLHTNGQVSENDISNIKSTGGAAVHALHVEIDAAATSSLIIANNFISNFASTGSSSANGISITSGSNIKLYYNTVWYSGAVANLSAALYVNGGSALDIRNNIFTNTGTMGTRYAVYSNASAGAYSQINYNDYYSTPNIGYLATIRANLANWKSATGKDANSINVNPTFTSTTNLHLTTANTSINNSGTPLVDIMSDIDGTIRNASFPDMGADEFGTTTCPTTTWNGTAWSNGVPTANTTAAFTGNYTATANINACSITVGNNAAVVIPQGKNIVLNGGLTVAAGSSFTLEHNANLLQPTGASNSGTIIVKRKSAAVKLLDYTLWSSPVSGQMLQQFSPGTVTSRFYTYNPATNLFVSVASPSTTAFASASGYLIRMPQSHPTTATVWEGTFTGVPNNGNITVPVTPLTYSAVGNPYPSAIDADSFISGNNLASPLYFWRKTNNASTSSYATYTLAGGTSTGNSGIANPVPGASLVPNGIITSAQGFITKSSGNSIVFNNTMRTSNINGTFLRTSESERHRIWLNLSTEGGNFSQTLISYMSAATNGVDGAIDGLYFNDSMIALNSIIEGNEYAIQGRSLPHELSDVVPLGFKTSEAGTYHISIDQVDGDFDGVLPVYLKDNNLGIIHDLKLTPYEFSTLSGVFNDRFEVVYQLLSLDIDAPATSTTQLLVDTSAYEITLKTPNLVMKSVRVYDVSGKLIMENLGTRSENTLPLPKANKVLVIQVVFDDGSTATRKLLH